MLSKAANYNESTVDLLNLISNASDHNLYVILMIFMLIN